MLFTVVAIVEPLWLKTRAAAHEEQIESHVCGFPTPKKKAHTRMSASFARHRRRAARPVQRFKDILTRNPNSDCSGIAQQRKSDLNSEGKCEIQDPNKKEFTGYQP